MGLMETDLTWRYGVRLYQSDPTAHESHEYRSRQNREAHPDGRYLAGVCRVTFALSRTAEGSVGRKFLSPRVYKVQTPDIYVHMYSTCHRVMYTLHTWV